MQTFYYKARHGNFGDDLNKWMWRELWPNMPAEKADNNLLIGIGTILGMKLPEGTWKKYVMGSGVGYLPLPRWKDESPEQAWEFLAVRGPLSAKTLGVPAEVAVTDSALLLRALPAYKTPVKRRSGIVFMPHLSAAQIGKWKAVCRKAGIEYLDPRWDSKLLLEKIGNAEIVLADAMHAAICADTLRTPWVPLATSSEISTFKWMDWTMGMKLPYKPTRLPASGLIELANELASRCLTRSNYLGKSSEELTEDQLLEWYHHEFSGKKSLYHTYIKHGHDFTRRFVIPGFIKLSKMSLLNTLTRPLDAFFIQRAARRLKTVADRARQGQTYLSDESLQKQKLETLLKRFEKVKKL